MSTTSRLDVVEVGGTRMSAITSSETRSNIQKILSRGSADVSPLFCGHGTQAPEIAFSTQDLTALLVTEGVGIFGLTLDAASNQYWKLVPEAGRNARSATSHTRCTINQGVVFWERITLRNNDISTADVRMMASYDGTNAPIVITGSVALPTSELAAVTYFGCGPIQINGTLIPYIQEVVIESGIQAEPKFSDSVPWPYRINLKTVEPTVTITTETMSNATSYGLVGGALNGTTGLACYGRKFVNNVASGAQRVAAATTEHLKITALNGTYHVDTISSSNEDAAQLRIMVNVTSADSSSTPVTFSASSAIPTS